MSKRQLGNVVSLFIGQSTATTESEVKSMRHWVLNYVIVLCSLFLVLVYEASMTATLVQESLESEFHSIDDLKNCKFPDHEVCIVDGDATRHFWDVIAANT